MYESIRPRCNRLLVRFLGVLLGCVLAVGLGTGTVYADDTTPAQPRNLLNGSFEEGQTWTDKKYDQPDQNAVPAWNTTAFEGKIELFRENTGTYIDGVTLKPSKGNYAAELNADEESTLYQNIKTTPSSVYEWGLDHGGRTTMDTIALIIGPKQSVDPSKPTKDGRDQLMQMVDWLIAQGKTSVKTSAGLGERITVYSKKFAASGSFVDNAGNNAFSLTPSTIYTEEWHIWIMASSRATTETVNPWNSYGSNASTPQVANESGSNGLNLNAYYLYTVPAGQTDTLFAFVSVGCQENKGKTFGNFLDNINFDLYHPLSGSKTTHGSVVIGVSDGSAEGGGASEGTPITIDGNYTTYVHDEGTLSIQAIVKKDDDVAGCEFVGLYYTSMDGNGNEKTVFLKKAGNEIEDTGSLTDDQKAGKWIKSTNDAGDTVYTYSLAGITTPTALHFVFIKNPTITYDSNGGKAYTVERMYNTTEAVNVYSFKPASGQANAQAETGTIFIPPYVSRAAEGQNDGWKFMGWLLTGDTVDNDLADKQVNADKLGSLILPAVHTVACDYSLNTGVNTAQYFKIYNGNVSLTKSVNTSENGETSGVTWNDNNEPKNEVAYANMHKGLTMVAQWRWRQAFIPQLGSGTTYTDSTEGGTVEITSVTDTSSNENYSASANGGKAYYAETNETVTAKATAKTGYTFEGWYDESGKLVTTKTELSYTETKESVKTYYARFSGSVTQTFKRQVQNGDNWEDTTDDSIGTLGRYTYTDAVGTPISSTATAGSGYYFAGWFDSEGNLVSGDMLTNHGNTISYNTTGDATYYARFSTQQIVIITVTGNSAECVYDGTTKNVNGYTVSYTQNGATTTTCPDGITLTPGGNAEANATAEGINAGEYHMTLSKNDFTVKCGSGITYSLQVIPGKLTIKPKPVTVTADNKSKTYGDNDAELTATVSGTINNDTVSYNVTRGTGENVGTYTITASGDTSQGNYTVTYKTGTFTINKADRQVSATNYSAPYDSNAHGIVVETMTGDTVYYSTDNTNWSTDEPKRTNVQNAEMIYVKVENPNYNTATANATITITPRPITITADSASKVYDGEALTKNSVTPSVPTQDKPNEGLVTGHTVTATVTGSQTKIGSSKNQVSGAVIKAGEADVTSNYNITYAPGTLEVTPATGITVTKTPERTSLTTGSTIKWTVTVTNGSESDAKGLTLTDTMEGAVVTAPEGVNYQSFVVPAKGAVVFTVTYPNAAKGTYINHVEVSQPREGGGAEILAQADAAAVTVSDPYIPPVIPNPPFDPDPPDEPDKPGLNTEDHLAYIIGYPNGTVRPEDNITRAEVATIFFRLLTEESRTAFWSQTNDFSDVSVTDWFNNAVSTLSNAGIIGGYPDGTFWPNKPITRAEFAAIAARFSEVSFNGGNGFTDVPENHWAARFIALAEHLGWVNGYPDGTFKPEQSITRAEAMTLINRVLERTVEEEHMLPDMVQWTDNLPGAWYYEAVQEATNSHEYVRLDKQVPDQDYCYEEWKALLAVPDWAALEQSWSTANSQ